MNLYGNVLFDDFGEKVNDVDFEQVEKILKRPIVKPRYRVSILNPDESIDYIIPESLYVKKIEKLYLKIIYFSV